MRKEEPNLIIRMAPLSITTCLAPLTPKGVREEDIKRVNAKKIPSQMRIAHPDLNKMTQTQKVMALNIVPSPTDWHPPSLLVGQPMAKKERAQSNWTKG